MNNILGQIYDIFKSFWSQNFDYYLWGWNPASEGFTNPNIFNLTGLVTIFISLLIVLIYYYIFNHPRWCRWWSWIIALVLNAIAALFTGFGITYSRYVSGYIPNELIYDYSVEPPVQIITAWDCWGFAYANILISIILFFVISLALKWWSTAAKYVPF